METIEQRLARWTEKLCPVISVEDLIFRCPTAHKWKAPYRSLVIREALLWRMTDLGGQAIVLTQNQHILGARILLRSSLETLALLVYLNQKLEAVVLDKLSFFEFDRLSMQLLMGSKNKSTSFNSINILTALEKAESRHEGLADMHKHLSESAHPNYDGVLFGYSKADRINYETHFSNRWVECFGQEQIPAMNYVFAVFEHEYSEQFLSLFANLEEWLRNNNEALKNQKNIL
jgi:hypothetical protein